MVSNPSQPHRGGGKLSLTKHTYSWNFGFTTSISYSLSMRYHILWTVDALFAALGVVLLRRLVLRLQHRFRSLEISLIFLLVVHGLAGSHTQNDMELWRIYVCSVHISSLWTILKRQQNYLRNGAQYLVNDHSLCLAERCVGGRTLWLCWVMAPSSECIEKNFIRWELIHGSNFHTYEFLS